MAHEMAAECAVEKAKDHPAPGGFGLRSLLSGAQNFAAGFMKDAPFRRTAEQMRGAAGSVVKSSARAWTRGIPSNRVHGYTEGRERMERIAHKARGTDRMMMLHRWIAVLRELDPGADASAPAAVPEADEEWQQLASSLMLESQGDEAQLAAVGSIVFVDESAPDATPMNFREVFLRSQALELLIEGFILHRSGEGDVKLLAHLLQATLQNGKQIARPLAEAITNLAEVHAEAARETVVVSASDLAKVVASTVASLKVNVEAEMLGRKMKALQEEVEARLQLAQMMSPESPRRSQAAAAAQALRPTSPPSTASPEAQQGQASPRAAPAASRTTHTTPHELQAAVFAMQNLWALACQLAEVTVQRNKLIEAQPAVHVSDVFARIKAASAEVADSVEEITQAQAELSRKSNEAGQHRNSRMHELDHQREAIASELETMTQQRTELLRQLAAVDEKLNAATLRLVELDEERSMFEEGVQVAFDVMDKEDRDLAQRAASHHAELDSLAASAAVLSCLKSGCSARAAAVEGLASSSAGLARQHCLAAAELLGSRLHELARLLLQQMRFCAAELEASDAKIEQMRSLGMPEDTSDVEVSRQRFLAKYLEAESRLRDVRRNAHNLAASLWFAPCAFEMTARTGAGADVGGAADGEAQQPGGDNDFPASLVAVLAQLKEMEAEAASMKKLPGAKRSFDGDEVLSDGSDGDLSRITSTVIMDSDHLHEHPTHGAPSPPPQIEAKEHPTQTAATDSPRVSVHVSTQDDDAPTRAHSEPAASASERQSTETCSHALDVPQADDQEDCDAETAAGLHCMSVVADARAPRESEGGDGLSFFLDVGKAAASREGSPTAIDAASHGSVQTGVDLNDGRSPNGGDSPTQSPTGRAHSSLKRKTSKKGRAQRKSDE